MNINNFFFIKQFNLVRPQSRKVGPLPSSLQGVRPRYGRDSSCVGLDPSSVFLSSPVPDCYH